METTKERANSVHLLETAVYSENLHFRKLCQSYCSLTFLFNLLCILIKLSSVDFLLTVKAENI